MSTPFDNYLENEVLSAHPVKLVCLLYRGAIASTEQARRHLAAGDIFARGRAIAKSIEILTELRMSLNREQGGELAGNLGELYDYIQHRLVQAHIEQSEAPLIEVLNLFNTLLDGWKACEQAARPVEESEPVTTRLAMSY
jgi:flagellar protein FliS